MRGIIAKRRRLSSDNVSNVENKTAFQLKKATTIAAILSIFFCNKIQSGYKEFVPKVMLYTPTWKKIIIHALS